MTQEAPKIWTIEDRLYANENRADRQSHLEIADASACVSCEGRPCTAVCPARTYVWSEEGNRLVVNYENCLECGGCRAVCPKSVISWRYPMGGKGICYRYG